jgi:hypothetical protein
VFFGTVYNSGPGILQDNCCKKFLKWTGLVGELDDEAYRVIILVYLIRCSHYENIFRLIYFAYS